MIICQVITTLVYGGAEKLLVNFTNILADKHQIHIIYLKGEPKLKSLLNERIKVHYIPLDVRCPSRLRKLLKFLEPDIVHTHLGHADLLGLWACRGLPLKRFCTMHNVYFKWNWVDKVIFALYRSTFTYHGKNCRVSCISNAVARHVSKTLLVKSENISVNYNAIPPSSVSFTKAEARRRLSLDPEVFVVLTIGRLRVQKSLDTLLSSIPELKETIPNFRILIVGEGELERDLKSLSIKLGIEHFVQFRGSTQTPEIYYAASDVFVLPSVFEGLPTVVLEAFRASLPVIASDIEGTNEIVRDGFTGLLFPPRNATALASKISDLYHSPERRQYLAKQGNLSYISQFEIRDYASQMENLYLK